MAFFKKTNDSDSPGGTSGRKGYREGTRSNSDKSSSKFSSGSNAGRKFDSHNQDDSFGGFENKKSSDYSDKPSFHKKPGRDSGYNTSKKPFDRGEKPSYSGSGTSRRSWDKGNDSEGFNQRRSVSSGDSGTGKKNNEDFSGERRASGSNRSEREKRYGNKSEERGSGKGGFKKDHGRSERPWKNDRRKEEASEDKSFGRRGPKKDFNKSDKPWGDKKKSYRDGEEGRFGEKKSFDQKKSYRDGDDKRFGERKDFGTKKPYGQSSESYADFKPGAPSDRKKSYSKAPRTKPHVGGFNFDKPVRLNKYIANAGICSRREADVLIQSGAVSVNGVIITELGTKVMPGDKVQYGGETLAAEKKVYILLNKPKDFITTTDDPEGRRTVMDLVKSACNERVFPVGRLDRETLGLLLLTNDGELAKKLTHPSHQVQKIYHVFLDKNVTKADMQRLVDGIELEDGEAFADTVSYAGDGTDKSQVGVEIHSGKNRIVRRMFDALGYKVAKLDRVVFASLTKKDLPRGHYRFLTQKEVNFLRML